MAVFSLIPGSTVILKSGGVYRQCEVAVYDNRLFAKQGSGFVALHRDGQTSAPRVTYEALEGVNPFIKHAKTALYRKEF